MVAHLSSLIGNMKRYPQPDFAHINGKRLRAHAYYLHSQITEPQDYIRISYNGVECTGCWRIQNHLNIPILFGHCGKWYWRLLYKTWVFFWWRIPGIPFRLKWFINMKYGHYTAKYCTALREGRCIGCNRKRDKPTPYTYQY